MAKGGFKTARDDAARNAILDAAEACAQKGKPLQMNDLADEAGIAVGTVYRYFDSKACLEQALVDRMFVSIMERIGQTQDATAPPAERLTSLIRAICTGALSHLGAIRVHMEASTLAQFSSDHGLSGEAHDVHVRYDELALGILGMFDLGRVQPETALEFLKTSMLAGIIRLANAPAEHREERIEEIVQLTTRGIIGCGC